MIRKTLKLQFYRPSRIILSKLVNQNQFYCLNQFYSSYKQLHIEKNNQTKYQFATAKQTQQQIHEFNEKSNYFQVLNISTSATQQQIKMAYLSMVKKHHPDLSKQQNASQKFQLIQKAYEILSDPQKRSSYRSTLNVSNSQTYQKADQIKQKFSSYSRKKNVPDEWQFSYKLFKKHYEQVDAKQKQYEKFVGQGEAYYVHKSQLKVNKKTYIQQVSMIAGSAGIAFGALYYMWG